LKRSAPTIQEAQADSASQITVSWTAATDEVGVTTYTLYRNGTASGTTPNLNYTDTGLAADTTYAYTVTAHDAAGNESTPSTATSVTTLPLPDTLAPTVTLTSPAHGATVAGSVTVTASASDNVGVLGVQFQLDGTNLGSEDTTNAYQVVWDTATVAPGTYTLTAIARDEAGNTTTSTPVNVTVPVPPDTTAPEVTLTAPTEGDTVSGTVTVSATASDNAGVVGIQFQLDGANLGSEDTTNDYQVVWDTSTVAPGTYTLTAIARDAAGNTSTSAPVTVTLEANSSGLTITNVTVQSGHPYVVMYEALLPGAQTYIDRTYTFTNIPVSLSGATYIQTANNDKNSTGSSFLSFDVNQPLTVYVAHDDRITPKPTWLNSFTNTGGILITSDTDFVIYSHTFSPGTITLGGNRESGKGGSMYSVAVMTDGGTIADTTPPSTPSILSAVANSSTQATISWEAATDNIGVTGYNVYRDGILISTTTSLSYVDSGLTPSTAYSYAVQAVDGAGNVSALSSATSVTTEAESTTNNGTAQLSWKKNPESDLSHYVVHYGTTSQVYAQIIPVGLTETPGAPSYTITGLASGTYYFTVRAVDTSGNESPPAPEGTKTITN